MLEVKSKNVIAEFPLPDDMGCAMLQLGGIVNVFFVVYAIYIFVDSPI